MAVVVTLAVDGWYWPPFGCVGALSADGVAGSVDRRGADVIWSVKVV